MTELMCNCEDFVANIELLAGDVLIFGYRREYTGKPLVFCPWCGKGLFMPIKPTEALVRYIPSAPWVVVALETDKEVYYYDGFNR